MVLDEFLDEGLLRNLPVVDGVRKIIKAAGSYSDYLFAKKLIAFVTSLSDVPKAERREQIEKLTSERDYQKYVGENLMLILDRMSDLRKPELLAALWKAFLQGTIEPDTLFRVSHAIESVSVEYIPTLRDLFLGTTSNAGLSKCMEGWRDGELILSPLDKSNSKSQAGSELDWQKLQHLASAGLMSMDFGRGGGVGGRNAGLRLNDDGRTLGALLPAR